MTLYAYNFASPERHFLSLAVQISYGFGLKQFYEYLGSCMDSSMQSLLEEEAAASEDVLCVPEYAEDIHRYLRECEVGIISLSRSLVALLSVCNALCLRLNTGRSLAI